MTGGLRTVLWLVLASLLQVPAGQAPGAAAGEDDLRAAIQQYYDAQGARDPDKAASFWSANANPRMTRDTFVALFGPRGEDAYTVEIRSVAIAGDEAKVRVMAVRTHVETLDPRPIISRTSFANAQTWHREAGVWKLLRDGLFADELADQYLAAAPADRPAFVEAQSPVDRNALRMRKATL